MSAGYVILFLKWLLPQTCMEVTVHNYKDTWYEHVDLIYEHVASNLVQRISEFGFVFKEMNGNRGEIGLENSLIKCS